jgi:D-arabinose 1-dehydrogenase-like Zn-dependent alcohol dehydrogenase
VPEDNVLKLAEDIPFDQGAICVDAVASMYHALVTQAKVKPGDKVVLLGIGGMGIQAIEIAHLAGASVLATSRQDKRLDFARKLGADVLVNVTRQDLAREVTAFTSGEGADIVLESIGAADTMRQAIELVHPGGKIIAIGLIDPEFRAPHLNLVLREVQIIGSRLATKQEVTSVLDLVAADRLHPTVAASYPLSDFKAGFKALERGEILGRGVLMP